MPALIAAGPTFGDGPGGTTVVITAPSGIVAGDLLLAYLHSDNDGNAAAMTAPAGWTQISSSADTTTTIGGFGKIWTKPATASEPGTYSFPGSAASDNTGFMWRINGHNPSAPFAALPVWSNPGAGATTSLIAPSVTLSASGLLVCGFTLEGMFGGSISPPGGMTGTSVLNSTGFVQTLPGFEAGKALGSTGTRTATATSSGSSNTQGYLTFSLAIADGRPVPQALAARRARPALPGRRERLAPIVPTQAAPAVPAAPLKLSARRAIRALRRRAIATPVITQVVVTPPARVQSPGRRVLARGVLMRRGRTVMKPRAQAIPPVPARAPRSRRTAFAPRRGDVAGIVPAPTAPLAPARVQSPARARRVFAILRRPGDVMVVPPQAVPAPPVKPPTVLSPRRIARLLRRSELVGPVPEQVALVAQSLGRARRVAGFVRRGVEVVVVPPQVAPLAPTKVPSVVSRRRISRPATRRAVLGPVLVAPQWVPAPAARRKASPARRRVAAPLVPLAAPDGPQADPSARRRPQVTARRGRPAAAPPVQPAAPPTAGAAPGQRRRQVPARRRPRTQPVPGQLTPGPARIAQPPSHRRFGVLARRVRVAGGRLIGVGVVLVPRAPRLVAGRRAAPGGQPGARARADGALGRRGSAGGGAGNKGSAAIEPGTRPGPRIEGGGD